MDVDTLMAEMADDYFAKGEVFSREDVFTGLADYAKVAYRKKALILVKGPEIHLYVQKGHRGVAISRRACADVLGPLIATYGYATTRLFMSAEPWQVEFVTRLGFKPTWSDGVCQYYILTSLPFIKKDAP